MALSIRAVSRQGKENRSITDGVDDREEASIHQEEGMREILQHCRHFERPLRPLPTVSNEFRFSYEGQKRQRELARILGRARQGRTCCNDSVVRANTQAAR